MWFHAFRKACREQQHKQSHRCPRSYFGKAVLLYCAYSTRVLTTTTIEHRAARVYCSECDSASSLDDVSLASWWSTVEVKSVDLERKSSFAYVTPSDTYVKAWYKLRELEVALCSSCLTTDQVVV